MLRLAAGEEDLFPVLVERVLPRLLGYFRRLGADPATAEDCAQEVLFKVYRHRHGYTARARFLTYLFHIARNHWIDVYRHRRAGPTFVSGAAGAEGPDLLDAQPAPAPAPAGEQGDLGALLREGVAALTPEQREVFVLAQSGTLPYEEISRILKIPVGTIKSRMHAAIRHLREFLRRRGVEP